MITLLLFYKYKVYIYIFKNCIFIGALFNTTAPVYLQAFYLFLISKSIPNSASQHTLIVLVRFLAFISVSNINNQLRKSASAKSYKNKCCSISYPTSIT